MEQYLKEKELDFEDVRCGKCCTPFFVSERGLRYDYGVDITMPWTNDLSLEELVEMNNRLAIEHPQEMETLICILTGELLKRNIEMNIANEVDMSEYEWELHKFVIERLMETLAIISGFMEKEKRRAKHHLRCRTEENIHSHI